MECGLYSLIELAQFQADTAVLAVSSLSWAIKARWLVTYSVLSPPASLCCKLGAEVKNILCTGTPLQLLGAHFISNPSRYQIQAASAVTGLKGTLSLGMLHHLFLFLSDPWAWNPPAHLPLGNITVFQGQEQGPWRSGVTNTGKEWAAMERLIFIPAEAQGWGRNLLPLPCL